MPEAHAAYEAAQARIPRTLFQHAHQDGYNAFPPELSTEITAEMFLLLPDNWNGTDALVLWFLGGGSMASTVNVTIDVGTCDETFDTHTQTVNAINMTVVLNEYECLDLTAIFETVIALMNARDMLWIKVTGAVDFSVYLIGAEIQET